MSVEQLRALGFTDHEIAGLVKRGYLHRLHRGVYAVGHRRLSRRGWLFAALLAAGDDAFLSHRTAAGVRGVCGLNTWDIHVTAFRATPRKRQGLVVHGMLRPRHPDDVKTVNGLRVATLPLILIQLAPTASRGELDRMITLAARKRMLDLGNVNAALARHPRAPGTAKLKAALAAYQPKHFDKSGLERAVAAAIAADPTIPPPDGRNVYREVGGILWEFDFLWEDERVVLEADGDQYHLTPQDKERDRLKDAKLMADGIVPLRITEVRWELDPKGAIDDLRTVLRRRKRSAA